MLKNNAKMKVLSLLLICVMLGMSFGLTAPVPIYAQETSGTNYYVDSAAGDDSNNGTSEDSPWKTLGKLNTIEFQPGDQILLKAGSVWNGEEAVLNGSGTEGNPITLSRYGEGPDPVLHGNGEVRQLVYLRNLSYWTVENLEITNTSPEEYVHSLMGITVEAIDAPGGVVSGIIIRNLYIHSINGLKSTGPVPFPALIYFSSGGTEIPSIFDGVLVKDCITMDSIPNGLNFYSSHTSNQEYYSKNVVIDNVSGNMPQIYWMLDGAVIQNNRLHDVRGYKPLYNSTVFAALFPTYSKNLIYQYNEITNTAPSGDSQGFDFDLHLKGTNIFQYNYTSGNAGALLVMQQSDPDVEMIYRYNVSHNDGAGQFRLGDSNVKIYNNIIINEDEEILINTWGDAEAPNEFYNNIFIGKTMQMKAEPGKENPIFDYNLFYGFPGPDDPHKINADPLFEDYESVTGLDTIDGFRLKPGSPAINAGKVIADNGGKDISGAPLYVDGPDIGIFEYQGTAENDLYEAEAGEVGGGAQVMNDLKASSGNYVGGIEAAGASVKLNQVNGGSGGDFYLRVYYSAEAETSKGLYVNEAKVADLSFSPTAAGSGFDGVATVGISLQEGTVNSIEIRSEEGTEGNLQIDRFLLLPLQKAYEAVDGEISGVDGYEGGIFTFKIRYANGSGSDVVKTLYVNGFEAGNVTLPPTGSSASFDEVAVAIPLRPGNGNSIALTSELAQAGEVTVDAYTVVKSTQIYEAQNGQASGGAAVRNNTEASGWNVVDGLDTPGASLLIDDVLAVDEGEYRLRIRYSTEEAAVKGLYVNGAKVDDVTYSSTGDFFNFKYAFATVTLQEGLNSIEIRNDGDDSSVIYLDRIEVILASIPEVTEPQLPAPPLDAATVADDVQFIEAEKAEISEGGPSIHAHAAVSNGFFVSSMHYPGRYIIWNNVNGGAGGSYTLSVGYRTGNDGSTLGVYVNGERQGAVDLPNTGWTDFSTRSIELDLAPGYNNSIMLKNDEMPGNVAAALDYFLLTREGIEPPAIEDVLQPIPRERNLVTNGEFDAKSTKGWVLGNRFSLSYEDKYTGVASVKLEGTGSGQSLTKTLQVDPNRDYLLTFMSKAPTGNFGYRIADTAGAAISSTETVEASARWTWHTLAFNSGDHSYVVLDFTDAGVGTAYLDNVEVRQQVATFDDAIGHWAEQTIYQLSKNKIVSGVAEGIFQPEREMTRAEFATIVVNGLGLQPEPATSTFTDVPVTAWYNEFVNAAYSNGLINGFEDGSFRPQELITREQAMMIIAAAMELSGLAADLPEPPTALISDFADGESVAAWAVESVEVSLQAGIVTGRSATELAPKANISRAEVATLVYRLLLRSNLI